VSKPVLQREPSQREEWADELLDRLTPAMSALGVIFALVVLGEQLTRPESGLGLALMVGGWLLWAVFVVEFVARMVVAPVTGRFLKRHWWQVIFLLLPTLRVLRLLRTVRLLRTGRVLSSAVMSSRSARGLLGSRLGWLGAVTVIVILSASQLLYAFAGYEKYADALHDAALATITGETLGADGGFAAISEVALASYSVVVFATVAGTLGAYFLRGERETPIGG